MQKIDNLDDDENRRDFDLLLRRTNTQNSATTTTTSEADNDIWPLYLTTNFIEHYIFGDVIGNGAYAEVRECIDTRNLERCAVKIVDKNYLKRQAPQALANQEQEIKLLKRLKHDNIISLKEILYHNSKIYIFLEYCPFVLHDLLFISLSTTIEEEFSTNDDNKQDDLLFTNSGLSLRLVRNLFKQLLIGLDYLHSQNIVHRDIKPQNLLITTSGILKIIDFGVSQILSLWSYPSDLCRNYEGSPLFQAPEVVSGQSEYAGFKVDVWSAGVTLYLLAYGEYPFMDEALLGLYDKILSDPLPSPLCFHHNHNNSDNKKYCNCSTNNSIKVLNDLLSMLMEKEASKRCSIDEALKHPWLMLNTYNNNSNSDNNDGYDEHSEFIELLLTHHLATSSSSSSSLSFASSKRVDVSRKMKEKENPDSDLKQRDIYLSMSVLPYLYNHHFPDKPVVKVNRKKISVKEQFSSSLSIKTTPSYDNTTISSTCPSNISNTTESTISSATTTSSQSLNCPTTNDSSPEEENFNPNQIIADREIEWGTERQYNLLKLPLIRANRIRDQSISNIKMAKQRKAKRRVVVSSSRSRMKKIKRRHSCRRKSNNNRDDENIKSIINNNKF